MEKYNKRLHYLHLPQETMEEILVRLPVKSLLRFSCVSKSWACLIREERFIKAHLNYSRENTTLASLIFNSGLGCETRMLNLKQFSPQSLMNETITNPSPFDRLTNCRIAGCCNGLVCIFDKRNKRFHLWNPSIRISTELPELDSEWEGHFAKYGFGWDSSSDTYKVFVFMLYSYRCHIYSSKTKAWTTLEHLHPEWRLDVSRYWVPFEEGEFVGGKLHWQKQIIGGPHKKDFVKIATMDLTSEETGMMDHPCGSDCRCDQSGTIMFHLTLGVIVGCLTVAHIRMKRELDIWVMKEYGVKESWFKLSSFSLHIVHNSLLLNWIPLYVGPNKEILVGCGGILLVYDPKKEVTLMIDGAEGLIEFYDDPINNLMYTARGCLCFESLVSSKKLMATTEKIKFEEATFGPFDGLMG